MKGKYPKLIIVSIVLLPTILSIKTLFDIADLRELFDFADYMYDERDAHLERVNEELRSEVDTLKDEVEYLQLELETSQNELRRLSRRVSTLELTSTLSIR